jgi:hypothetical protein
MAGRRKHAPLASAVAHLRGRPARTLSLAGRRVILTGTSDLLSQGVPAA